MCGRHGRLGELHAKISILFSYLDFYFLSSKILQNNLLHLYLVKIRRYKLSFFAKPATNSLPHFSDSVKLITHRGLGLAKSICAPNLETTGSNAKFGEYISLSVLKLLYLHYRETIYETQYDL